uniref:Ovule protein n=1 Tax=Heterorhabditis bacteriophora TaxID=37862 RepID=A0A1I7WAY3_HETBA
MIYLLKKLFTQICHFWRTHPTLKTYQKSYFFIHFTQIFNKIHREMVVHQTHHGTLSLLYYSLYSLHFSVYCLYNLLSPFYYFSYHVM